MNQRTRIKICGITRPKDAVDACALGADAIGLVFYPPSPRFVSNKQAAALVAVLPPFVTTVALFMNAERSAVVEVIDAVPIGLLQFHGDETPEFCESFGLPYIKSVPMGAELDLTEYTLPFKRSSGFLLDSNAYGEPGGSGVQFDWQRVPTDFAKPLILAGGLTPENVATAVDIARPYGVDVSSGVEASKGIKDFAKMQSFINGVERGRKR